MRLMRETAPTPQQTVQLLPPVKGFTTGAPFMGMKPTSAVTMENFYPFPDRLQMRPGYNEHSTGFAAVPYRLWVYASGSGAEKLFATTDSGLYDITSGGSVPSASIALTNGKTIAVNMTTGANHYFFAVNGTDSMIRYDGTTWSSVATLGVATNTFSYIEVYRQRLFFALENSLTIYFLPINSISGTAVSYDLGAIFRRGGYIVGLGTWTLDGGYGPEDQFAVVTSKGEVAVFVGNDPSNSASWSLRGVYFIGRPLGARPLYKYGGDLLYLSENGLYPLSSAVQSASIDRVQAVTEDIRQYFNDSARNFGPNEGWQILSIPDTPLLLVNIPASPVRKQVIMHAQTGAWSSISGWDAYAFERMGTSVYFSTSTGVMKVTGVSDNGANIVATLLQAYSDFGYPGAKQVVGIRPSFISGGNFQYSIGWSKDFSDATVFNNINLSGLSGASLWGSGLWGSAIWGGTTAPIETWQTVFDGYSRYKALYLQISSRLSSIQYLGARVQYLPSMNSLD